MAEKHLVQKNSPPHEAQVGANTRPSSANHADGHCSRNSKLPHDVTCATRSKRYRLLTKHKPESHPVV